MENNNIKISNERSIEAKSHAETLVNAVNNSSRNLDEIPEEVSIPLVEGVVLSKESKSATPSTKGMLDCITFIHNCQ